MTGLFNDNNEICLIFLIFLLLNYSLTNNVDPTKDTKYDFSYSCYILNFSFSLSYRISPVSHRKRVAFSPAVKSSYFTCVQTIITMFLRNSRAILTFSNAHQTLRGAAISLAKLLKTFELCKLTFNDNI